MDKEHEKEYRVFLRGEYKVIEVDTNEAKYRGIKWKNLGDFGKRKYENYIALSNNTGLPMRFIYH